MNDITERIIEAWVAGRALRIQGSSTTILGEYDPAPLSETDGKSIWYRGNKIVRLADSVSGFEVSDGGYRDRHGLISKTTRTRLNGLGCVDVWSENGVHYLNGVEWDGEWVDPIQHVIDDGGEVIVEVTLGHSEPPVPVDTSKPRIVLATVKAARSAFRREVAMK